MGAYRMRPYGPDIVGADSISARTFLLRLIPVPHRVEQFLNAVVPALQVQPAQQTLKAGGGAVLLHGGVLGDSGLAGVFAAAQHGASASVSIGSMMSSSRFCAWALT